MTKEWQEAMNERAKAQKMNPISGKFISLRTVLSLKNSLIHRYRIGGIRGQGFRAEQVEFYIILGPINYSMPPISINDMDFLRCDYLGNLSQTCFRKQSCQWAERGAVTVPLRI